jgi:hypothetical protein
MFRQRRDADDTESVLRFGFKQKVKLYVRRGFAFRLAEGEELIVGEAFYRKRPIAASKNRLSCPKCALDPSIGCRAMALGARGGLCLPEGHIGYDSRG